jgi:peptidyl-prolyl cis-trans isomerase SurA
MSPEPGKRVLEEIVARVNNEIITLSDLRRAGEQVRQEVDEDCRNCSAEERAKQLAERDKHLLRDLIDQQLLVQRAKDMGVNVEADVIRRLEEIRVRNNFADLEELQRRVEEAGLNWEDFKNNIRNSLLTQEVIRSEVLRKIIVDKAEIERYYGEHKQEFERPEIVYLSEIFCSTVDKSEEDIPKIEQRCRELRQRALNGDDFGELAKRFSDGQTAKQGGELGGFEKGKLAKEIEEVVFKMKRNELTDLIRTQTGFIVLRVEQRFEAGIQPLDKVEGEVAQRIQMSRMQPRMRDYLAKLRSESYVLVKPGYVDSAAVDSAPITEIAGQAEEEDGGKKKSRKNKKPKDE